jgi:hypothetical protein
MKLFYVVVTLKFGTVMNFKIWHSHEGSNFTIFGSIATNNEFCDTFDGVNSFCVVCRAKDCDALHMSVDEDEEKELQVCQFVASFVFALSVSLVI